MCGLHDFDVDLQSSSSADGVLAVELYHASCMLWRCCAVVQAMVHPGLTWVYVSGDGTDEKSRMEWARIKVSVHCAGYKHDTAACHFQRAKSSWNDSDILCRQFSCLW